MVKVVLLILTVFSLFAQEVGEQYVEKLKNHLLSRDFPVTGKFYHINGDWILMALTPEGKEAGLYRLLGKEPTADNPFGWSPASIDDINEIEESGYFIYIGFDKNSSLSWLYIDKKSMKVYKLIQAEAGKFRYLLLDGISYGILKNIVSFFSKEDILKYSFLVDIDLKRAAKSFGKIDFDPRYLSSEESGYKVKKPIVPTSVVITELGYGKIGKDVLEAEVTKFPLLGLVKIKSSYKNGSIECEEHYQALNRNEINSSAELKDMVQEWGDIKDMEFTTCPQEYYENIKGDRFDFFGFEKDIDFAVKKVVEIYEDNGSKNSLTVFEKVNLTKSD